MNKMNYFDYKYFDHYNSDPKHRHDDDNNSQTIFYIFVALVFICSSITCYRCLSDITYNFIYGTSIQGIRDNIEPTISEISENSQSSDSYREVININDISCSNKENQSSDDDSTDLPTYNEACRDN